MNYDAQLRAIAAQYSDKKRKKRRKGIQPIPKIPGRLSDSIDPGMSKPPHYRESLPSRA